MQEGAGRRAIHRKIGTVEPATAGEYVVSASMSVGSENYAPRIVLRA